MSGSDGEILAEYMSDAIMLERIGGAGEDAFCYLGYAIDNENDGLASLNAYEALGPEAILEGEAVLAATGEPTDEAAVISRLQERRGPAAESQSAMPILWQVPDPDRDTGGWVLFMDGHTEWRGYPGEFPMTEAFIGRIRAIQSANAE